MSNSFVAGEMPDFTAMDARRVGPAVAAMILEHRRAIGAMKREPNANFESVFLAKERADSRFYFGWMLIMHLAAVCDSPAYRDAFRAAESEVAAYFAEYGQDREVLGLLENVRGSLESVNSAEQRAVDLAIRAARLSGVDLPETERARFAAIAVEASKLSTDFANAVLDATQAWTRRLAPAELAGMPVDALEILTAAGRRRGVDGPLATLDDAVVSTILRHCADRAVRQEVYEANVTRASEVGPHGGQFANGERMLQILALRWESAALLGFANPIDASLFVKMARDYDDVRSFVDELSALARPAALREYEALKQEARSGFAIDDLAPWDVPFVSEKVRQVRFGIDDSEVRQYFPISRVWAGVFERVQALYGVSITETSGAALWHPDARSFVVERDGALVGHLYVDLYARSGKRGGAWMTPVRSKLRGSEQTPIAFLTCNFAPSSGGEAYLFHRDVVTLFHEMGHCLHHLLSTVDLPSIAGVSGVEWDAVELPSQFHEEFAWHPHVLRSISAHADDGSPLPDALIEKLIGARRFNAGLALLRQLELGNVDLALHHETVADHDALVRLVKNVQTNVAIAPSVDFNRMAHAFTHVFSGGYAAGYFSYLWAERLSADAHEPFRHEDVDLRALGEVFLEEILSKGASRPSMESFVAFRGREPKSEALARQRGLAA